ncbi:MAG: hypothetical protein ACR2RE_03890 [Geminicoccaceae bacterium]
MTERPALTKATDFILTVDDCRKAGHCAIGIRRWFETHGYDFRDVLKNGRSAAELLAIDDAQMNNVITKTLERHHGR